MKNARRELSTRYLTALRTHLGNKRSRGSVGATELGHAALASGFASRDLAVMHENALLALTSVPSFELARRYSLRRAGHFFTETLVPLEADLRATRVTNRRLQQRNSTLRSHSAELARGNLRLKREITRRKSGEIAIRKGKEQY